MEVTIKDDLEAFLESFMKAFMIAFIEAFLKARNEEDMEVMDADFEAAFGLTFEASLDIEFASSVVIMDGGAIRE